MDTASLCINPMFHFIELIIPFKSQDSQRPQVTHFRLGNLVCSPQALVAATLIFPPVFLVNLIQSFNRVLLL
ncbi:hypothetical protein M501DRAFT_1004251 [Patellaria atrata CBS 101060]|uniref:Uncharacterized protein n=1 Tax=Patellaria atrata CBS 101060 TaxID=1346257 RepID=A0A9P4VQN0_9PEZI|nr:hypothetical protein M501DRAFT_1004251 [Patellaria atrata CBS 101060]